MFKLQAVVASIYSTQPCMTSLLPFRYSILVNNPSPGETTDDHRSSTALAGCSRVAVQVNLRVDHIIDRDGPHSTAWMKGQVVMCPDRRSVWKVQEGM